MRSDPWCSWRARRSRRSQPSARPRRRPQSARRGSLRVLDHSDDGVVAFRLSDFDLADPPFASVDADGLDQRAHLRITRGERQLPALWATFQRKPVEALERGHVALESCAEALDECPRYRVVLQAQRADAALGLDHEALAIYRQGLGPWLERAFDQAIRCLIRQRAAQLERRLEHLEITALDEARPGLLHLPELDHELLQPPLRLHRSVVSSRANLSRAQQRRGEVRGEPRPPLRPARAMRSRNHRS